MADFSIRQNDLLEPLVIVPTDVFGAIVDHTTATGVAFRMNTAAGAAVTLTGTADIVPNYTIGDTTYAWVLRYQWGAGDTATAGEFVGRFRSTFPTALPQSFPTKANTTILIFPDLV